MVVDFGCVFNLSVDCCSFSVASGDVPAQAAIDHNLIDFDTE